MLVFSGIQPTGNLHLGNYLGAIKQWVDIQHKYPSIFCIVDLHAITQPQDPEELHNSTLLTTAAYIASGIEPKNCIIFPQSSVTEHTELTWILSCFTPMGWLNRMTQFKEKAGKHKDRAVLGLYSYPVLMAADILLYKATHVPVGEDQKQHLELSREIAGTINHHYKKEIFPLPEPLIQGAAPRVMSLRDGKKKMSKSDTSDMSRINLTDSSDLIVKKIKKAKSDAIEGISYDPDNRPEASNLIRIYAALADEKIENVEKKFSSTGFSQFKEELAELAVNIISPIRTEINYLMNDRATLSSILKKGAEESKEIASKTMKEIKELVGLYNIN